MRILVLLALAASSAGTAESPWWNPGWKKRATIEVKPEAGGVVRVKLPAEAKPAEIRVVAGDQVLRHWTQTFELSDVQTLTPGERRYHSFPRLVQAKNGDLLVTYRVGKAHTGPAHIVLRASKDGGTTWSPERTICDVEQGSGAQNVILLPTGVPARGSISSAPPPSSARSRRPPA